MMDRRTIYVILICFLIFFGWNKYLTTKYPNYGNKQSAPATTVVQNPGADSQTNNTEATTGSNLAKQAVIGGSQEQKSGGLVRPESEVRFESETLSFSVSSRGMGLKDIVLNGYTDKEKNKIKLGQSDEKRIFEVRLGALAQPLDFDLKALGDGKFVGEASFGSTIIQREMKFDKKSYSFSSITTITKATDEILKGVRFYLPEKITVKPSTSFLFPSYEHQDFFVGFGGKNETINFSAATEDVRKEITGASLVALSSQYFTTAFLDKSDILPDANLASSTAQKSAIAEVVYHPATIQDSYKFEQIFYVGPKSIDILKSANAEFAKVIDFGMFEFIATPLLYVMKYFFEIVSNWGIAIILLTLLVRLLVLPFNIMSMKSMKAMQKIQPLMTSVREKFKDDPVRMNQEIMALMKENKANPLGGCLPMLLQIPIFFALYRVIGSSIELYQSPFFGWINDLSHHDRFYVLPVLMGITMYVQQKMTPTNMDPAQAKIMAFLPLIFTFFMLQLPSGLTLYMFVSALFGITQQWYMLRDKKSEG
jgi:YidC/Oxa1 family membrane protein insertase